MSNLVSQTLTGFYKELYGEQVKVIPEVSKLQKDIKFIEAAKQAGGEFVNNVVLTQEHGVSYLASNAGLSGLNDRVPMVTGKASVLGSNLLIRSGISYEDAERASSDKKAFASLVPMIIENMTESLSKRLEISLLYGQSDLGLCTFAPKSGTTSVGTFATGEFSGIWAGAEQARVACTVGGTVYGPFKVIAVDFTNKTITLDEASDVNGADGALTGDIDNIAGQSNVGLFFYGSIVASDGSFRDMIGLDKILTTSGSLFGINNSTYALWKGNAVSVSGRMTFCKLIAALNTPVIKGLQEKIKVYVPVVTWQNLNADQAALRRYDGSYSKEKGEMGHKSIVFYGQSGEVEIVAHPFLKENEAFAIPVEKYRRVGATDITFKTPGKGDDIFHHLENNFGYEIRAFCNQALFPRLVSTSVKIYGFTNE